MEKFYAVMIDMVGSKKMNEADRYISQKHFLKSIKVINYVYANKIKLPMTMSSGDSIQGLFNDVESAYCAYYLIRHLLFPCRIRCGIGVGEINMEIANNIKERNSNINDGLAYHLAKNAIDEAKEYGKEIVIKKGISFDVPLNVLLQEEEMDSFSRASIYALINIISPIADKDFSNSANYLKMVSCFITDISKLYRSKGEKELCKEDLMFSLELKSNRMNSNNFINEENVFNMLKNEILNTFNPISEKQYQEYLMVSERSTTINADTRKIIRNLTGTSSQNINNIILSANMEQLRKKYISKIELLKVIYNKDETEKWRY